MAVIQPDPSHLRGLVDMGSNGVRFSISDLTPATARTVPTLYTDRAGISLYDAQYSATGERIPIPDQTIRAVVRALVQFKRTCKDFGVPDSNITILATEATRTALNSVAFRQQIKDATNWEVTMLAKEEEGRTGAMGVASSLGEVMGLVMDLGGGSTQLTWLISNGDQALQMPASGAVSMPFGAAALSRGLQEADAAGGNARQKFADEIKDRIREAYESLKVPRELEDVARADGGFDLYLSGGGFRGWGFVLMSQHAVKPYPIPVINGFRVNRRDFLDTAAVQSAVLEHDSDEEDAIFRVSQRRASQVPAVAFLVKALSEALPQINAVRFCQGGVREGYLFSTLSDAARKQQPLAVATQALASPSAAELCTLLAAALPHSEPHSKNSSPSINASPIPQAVFSALANTLNLHSTHPKDIRAASALRFTTTGLLASVHGLSHTERALLSLLLCERWGGEKALPPAEAPFLRQMQALLDPWTQWWVRYLGRVAALVGAVYVAGRVRKGEEELGLQSAWTETKKGNDVVVLRVGFQSGQGKMERAQDLFAPELGRVEKMGKKKHWIGGKDGYGHKVEVVVGAL